jgi:hypothetical protein
MAATNRLERLETKFPWTIIGVLISILFGLVGVYSLLHERKPEILVEILNESNVLDIRQPIKNLQITFQGEDIQQKNLNLKIITVRLSNAGGIDILQSYYDTSEDWGIGIKSGRIVEARISRTNSPYLSTNLRPTLVGDTKVRLSKVILERDKFFVIELLVLHPRDQNPEVMPFGKIAGIDAIGPVRAVPPSGKPSLWVQIFQGPPIVQISRALTYGVAALVILVSLVSANEWLSTRKDASTGRQRQRYLEAFARARGIAEDSQEMKFLKLYVEFGSKGLERLRAIVSDKDLASLLAQRYEHAIGEREARHEYYSKAREKGLEGYRVGNRMLARAAQEGSVRVGGGAIFMDPAVLRTLNDLLAYLGSVESKQLRDLEPRSISGLAITGAIPPETEDEHIVTPGPRT